MVDPASVFLHVFYVIYALTILGTLIVVISENANPSRTLAWVVVLLLLPVVGLVFFYFFGLNYKKKKKISSQYRMYFKNLTFNVSKFVDDTAIYENQDKVRKDWQTLVELLVQANNSAVFQGSDIDLFTRGHDKFAALVNDLENAKHHIHMEYFYFKKDHTGKKIKEILMRKAREGVEVRFIYENIANITISPRYFYEMKEAGVIVAPFAKISLSWIRQKLNFRNHRKVVVIDGHIGYIGGMNVGDEYACDPNWRDTHIRISGQGVYGLQEHFLFDWYTSGEKQIENYSAYFPEVKTYSDNLLQIASGGPDTQWPNLLLATIHIVHSCRKYLYIQTPYFIPADSLYKALQAAALGGVDVRLMVSKKSDSAYLDPAIHSYYEELLRCGVRIYEHQTKFIHAKTMVTDDYISVIGSANMDFRSFEASFEINSYLYDETFAKKNRAIFREDMKGCKEIMLNEWVKRSRRKKLLESIVRLFAPLL